MLTARLREQPAASASTSTHTGGQHNLPAKNKTSKSSTEKWCLPTSGKLQVTRAFEAPAHKYARGHRGLDILGDDDRVFAPAAGTITFVGVVVDRPVISVQVTADLVYSLEPVSSNLQVGDKIAACEELGTILYGHTRRQEIHLGVRMQDEYVNPLPYFAARPRLLPLNERA